MKRRQLKMVVMISLILVWFSGAAWAGGRGDKPNRPEQRSKAELDHQRHGSGNYQRPPVIHAHPSFRRPQSHRPAPYHKHHPGFRQPPRHYRPLPPRHGDRHIQATPLIPLIPLIPIIPVPPLPPLPGIIFHPTLDFGFGVEVR